MQVALAGLGQSGRTSLFAALGGSTAAAGGGGRGGNTPVVAVKVPDPRLDWLREQYNPKKFTPASIDVLDMAGLRFDDHQAAGENTRIVSALRLVDCIVAVIRGFEGADAAAYRGSVDPVRDRNELYAEFALADLAMVESRLDKLNKAIGKSGSKALEQDKREQALLVRCQEALEQNKALLEILRNPDEIKMVKSFSFLTQKPIVWALNVSESALPEPTIPPAFAAGSAPVFALCAKAEKDLAELDPADRAVFAAELGIKESAKDRLIRGCYDAMGLISFLTSGEDEVRAWTLHKGATAVEAAGAIHSDLADSFVKAETVAYADLRAAGGMKAARAVGKLRQEGKGYIVADGDVIEIKAGKAK